MGSLPPVMTIDVALALMLSNCMSDANAAALRKGALLRMRGDACISATDMRPLLSPKEVAEGGSVPAGTAGPGEVLLLGEGGVRMLGGGGGDVC